ncbi:glycosyltransferase family 4 protein [Chryseolinea lacunae]|uniref:Glycosyltransferase n=1 Tax=Chryseolinea lacunae TaxID=2801331 RepID=A0ABS1L2B0_9BACT|nr:glycosyltransferase [Chryseolinea lacunae]MBL0745844.1 glycosyltransferase [Chryseolinea lacunae]
MKIYAFHLLNDYSGSPKVLMQLIKGWVKKNMDVTVVTSSGRDGFLSNLQGVRYVRYWYRWAANPWLRLFNLSVSQALLFFTLFFKVKKGDVLYINTVLPFGAAFLGKAKGCCVVYHIHETTMRPPVLKKFLFGIVRWAADQVIYVSHALSETEPMPGKNVQVCYNAMEDSFLAMAEQNVKPLGAPRNVLMVCSLKVYKGIYEFLALAEWHPECQFRLVVNASRTDIDRFVQGVVVSDNVEIFSTQTDLHPFYRWADVVVNLSRPDLWVETFGLTVLEGMAYGLPCIVPPVGGIAEIVTDGVVGFHADSRNLANVSVMLKVLLNNNHLYRYMKAKAKARVEHFREASMEAQSFAMLSRLCGGKAFHDVETIPQKPAWFASRQPFIHWHTNGISPVMKSTPHPREKKKVAVIGTVGLPANYGGFETLADHLVKNLGDQYHLTVYCSGRKYPKPNRLKNYLQARLTYVPLDANGIQSIAYDTLSILHALLYADVLLILGVAGAWMLPFVRLFTNKKIIISIDGIEWKRDKWNTLAKCYLWWAEKLAVRYSHIDISDNESIQDYTAKRYGTLSRIIEYGADHTLHVSPAFQDKEQYSFLRKPYAFKVCRIEPENNVHEVLAAFAKLPRHTFVMVGNWEKSAYGRDLRRTYKDFANLHLLDPIYNQRTLDMLRGNALVYVHGHSAGGTNPSLVEAMHLGLPVIAFNVSYNRTTTEDKALYFRNAEELVQIIETTSVHTLKELANTMRQIAMRRYTWKLIASKYAHLVQEVLTAKVKPSIAAKVTTIDEAVLARYQAEHLKFSNTFYEKR